MIPVMLIEDEFLVRIGLKTCIDWAASGYEVVAEAEDGESALEFYKLKRPQLILTDIRLPHKSGMEVMREIREQDKAVRFIIISAFDDFKIAQEAISLGVEGYFVKGDLDTDELVAMLERIKEKYFKYTFSAKSNLPHIESLQNIYRQGESVQVEHFLNFPITSKELYLCLFQIEDTDADRFSEMLHMFLEQQGAGHQSWITGKSIWYFVSPNENRISELFDKIKIMIQRYLHAKVRIGISNNYYEKKDIKSTIYEAILAADYLRDKSGICMEYYIEKDTSGTRSKASVKKIDELLHRGQYELCRKEVQHLREVLRKHYSVQRFFKSVYKLVGIIVEYDDELSLYNNILETLDCDKIFYRIEAGIKKVADKASRGKEDNIYIANAKAYVYEHYQEQINISIIAQYVHVSASYLGKIFLNETGEYLTDFINKVKIEKAKELLAEQKYAINEVAMQVGVADQRYFSKLFKKYCGISPKEYVNKVKKITH